MNEIPRLTLDGVDMEIFCLEFALRRNYVPPRIVVERVPDQPGGDVRFEPISPRVFFEVQFFDVTTNAQLLPYTKGERVYSAPAVVRYAGKTFTGSIVGFVYYEGWSKIDEIRFRGKDIE